MTELEKCLCQVVNTSGAHQSHKVPPMSSLTCLSLSGAQPCGLCGVVVDPPYPDGLDHVTPKAPDEETGKWPDPKKKPWQRYRSQAALGLCSCTVGLPVQKLHACSDCG